MIFIICIPLYLILLLFNKRLGFLHYQLFVATVYLVSLSYNQTLDLTLVFYMIFAALPYIKYFKIYVGFSAYIFFYFLFHLLASMLLNSVTGAISIFCIRLVGLMLFYYLFSIVDFSLENTTEKNNFTFVCAAVICELIIYLIGNSLSLSESGRLMLNYQCTVGCIATGTLLYLAYYLYTHNDHIIGTMVCMLILTAIACASGTRGYIVVSLAITFISFFLRANAKWRVIMILIGALVLLFAYRYLADIFYVDLRMGSSTGRRHSENLFVLQFMWERPFYVWLFGNGFGAVVGNFSISESIISAVADSSYTYQVLHTVSGFHNFYGTIFYSAGVVGLVLVLAMYIKIVLSVIRLDAGRSLKIILLTFLGSYAFLLWYRWTATSGILEFAMFAYVMNDIRGIGGGNSTLMDSVDSS